MNWDTIWRDAVPSIAGAIVYDTKTETILGGRYLVAKTMKLPSGTIRRSQKHYFQRPAAIHHATKFLEQRAAKAGTEYVSGDGAKTMLYKPI